jgi:hypothetical protein
MNELVWAPGTSKTLRSTCSTAETRAPLLEVCPQYRIDKRPTALTMPSFAWKLTDMEIADVSTFIRNSWGNQAPAVSADAISAMRKRLGLDRPRLTVNSGDHP